MHGATSLIIHPKSAVVVAKSICGKVFYSADILERKQVVFFLCLHMIYSFSLGNLKPFPSSDHLLQLLFYPFFKGSCGLLPEPVPAVSG